jgi:hypothetical protein
VSERVSERVCMCVCVCVCVCEVGTVSANQPPVRWVRLTWLGQSTVAAQRTHGSKQRTRVQAAHKYWTECAWLCQLNLTALPSRQTSLRMMICVDVWLSHRDAWKAKETIRELNERRTSSRRWIRHDKTLADQASEAQARCVCVCVCCAAHSSRVSPKHRVRPQGSSVSRG